MSDAQYQPTRQGDAADKRRVLLMDDEETVLKVTQRLLAHLGYDVATASNGEEAVESYRQAMQADQPFDLVILDLTVPGGMDGREAMAQLRQMDPRVRAIVSSGSAPDIEDYSAEGFLAAASKPYQIDELKRVIDEVVAKR
jgi:CheY-like chemotaxis protein